MNRWRRMIGRERWTRRGVVLVVAAATLVSGVAVVYAVGANSSSSRIVDYWPSPTAPSKSRDAGSAESTADAPATAFAAPAAPGTQPGSAAAPAPGVPVGAVQRSLVRAAQVAVEVGDPEVASRQVRAAAAAAGGYVTEEQTGTTSAWVVLRVPADGLERLVDQIAALGMVVERTAQVVDATEEVVDLDARVASQQASVARVRALLARAESIGDVVSIESELSRREAELDSLTGRLGALREQVALSTLTVDLRAAATPDPDDPATFAAGLGAGWDWLRAAGSAVAAVVGFVLPFLPVLAVLAGIGWLARRTVRARRAA